jgi:diguanylate cyclase (GGDEF)-like protein
MYDSHAINRFITNCRTAFDVSKYLYKQIFIYHESFEQTVGLKDDLTKLLNKKALFLHTKMLKPGACLLLIDVDNFKFYNDAFGHSYGDVILQKIARVLRNLKSEMVMPFRLYGDEFLMLCDHMSTALAISKTIREAIATLGRFTVSQGIGRVEPKDTPRMVFDKADKALYQSKLKGKDCVTVYKDSAQIMAYVLKTSLQEYVGTHQLTEAKS